MKHKAGQLIIGGFEGTMVTPQARELIEKYHTGSMILSSKNVINAKQTKQLIYDLQQIAFHAGYTHPIMFAIDEEGGMLNSLFDNNHITQFPGAMGLAATGDEALVHDVCKAIATELKSIGFAITLGPVLDVVAKMSHQLVGVRSFGTTVDAVVKYGRAAAKGWKAGGLLTFGKHFPGIGSASVDSLLELPMMPDTLTQIENFNVIPFQKLIEENLLDGISAAGCAVPTISPDETHACLSPVIINQLLRSKMKFDGAVISECLEMDALYHNIGLGQGVIMALFAGCDLVMVCHDFRSQKEALSYIEKGMANGNLDNEIVEEAIRRIRVLQKQQPSWEEIFNLKTIPSELWLHHQELSRKAYQKCITLVRDYNCLPISRFLNSPAKEDNNVLLLTPLLHPLYSPLGPSDTENNSDVLDDDDLYPGEDIFQRFGELLAKYKDMNYNVLHTTYTANGLTSLHETLIERSKVIIVLSADASRNMYQIGIVKYISILCGNNPSNPTASKPLIIVSVSSPYDFFYNRNIGSTYICCYEYTENVLEHLPAVLFGDVIPSGNIPGEKVAISKRSPSQMSAANVSKKRKQSRRWLVDEFDIKRDWNGLSTLWNNAIEDGNSGYDSFPVFENINSPNYLNWLFVLLNKSSDTQKHFVIRNSSLNLLYGFCLTWIDTDSKEGSILFILVDKSKRNQSVGKNLHQRAIRYLKNEKGVKTVTLGCSFPLITFPRLSLKELSSHKTAGFLKTVGWKLDNLNIPKKHVMLLDDLNQWTVPQKIFRELVIVGVRFDICHDPDKLTNLVAETCKGEELCLKDFYKEAIENLDNGIRIIIALEPSNQTVIGSIVLFTNKSSLARYFPFIEDAAVDESTGEPIHVGGIAGQLIDPSYTNLTEVFKFGLICSAITYFKPNIGRAILCGVEDRQADSIKDVGFTDWKHYYDYYDKKEDWEM